MIVGEYEFCHVHTGKKYEHVPNQDSKSIYPITDYLIFTWWIQGVEWNQFTFFMKTCFPVIFQEMMRLIPDRNAVAGPAVTQSPASGE